MGNNIIFAGIAAGIVVIAAGMFYVTDAQQQAIPDTATAAPATEEGQIATSSLGPTINKEKWHADDPFKELADKVKAEHGL